MRSALSWAIFAVTPFQSRMGLRNSANGHVDQGDASHYQRGVRPIEVLHNSLPVKA